MEGDIDIVHDNDPSGFQQLCGCGDTGTDVVASPFDMEWDTYGDGGYDGLCHDDIIDDYQWLNVCELAPPLQLDYDVEIIGSIDPRAKQRTNKNYSSRPNSPANEEYKIAYSDDIDEVYSSVSTEYLSCPSDHSDDEYTRPIGNFNTQEPETKSINLQFSSVFVNIDVTVSQKNVSLTPLTIDRVDSLPQAGRKKQECENWLKQQNYRSAIVDNSHENQRTYTRKEHGKIFVKGPQDFSFTSLSSVSFWKDCELDEEKMPSYTSSDIAPSSVSSGVLDIATFQSKIYSDYTLTSITPSSSLDDTSTLQNGTPEPKPFSNEKISESGFRFDFDFDDGYIEDSYMPFSTGVSDLKLSDPSEKNLNFLSSASEERPNQYKSETRETTDSAGLKKKPIKNEKIIANKSDFQFMLDFNMEEYLISDSESDKQNQTRSQNCQKMDEEKCPWLKIYQSDRDVPLQSCSIDSDIPSAWGINDYENTSQTNSVNRDDPSSVTPDIPTYSVSNRISEGSEAYNNAREKLFGSESEVGKLNDQQQPSLYSRFVNTLQRFYYGKESKIQATGNISQSSTKELSGTVADDRETKHTDGHSTFKKNNLAVAKQFVKNVISKSENEVLLEYWRIHNRICQRYKTKTDSLCSSDVKLSLKGRELSSTDTESDNSVVEPNNLITSRADKQSTDTESDNSVVEPNNLINSREDKQSKKDKVKNESFYSRFVDSLHLLYLGKVSSESDSSSDSESQELLSEKEKSPVDVEGKPNENDTLCDLSIYKSHSELASRDETFYENQILKENFDFRFDNFGSYSKGPENYSTGNKKNEENDSFINKASVSSVRNLIDRFEQIIDDSSGDVTPAVNLKRNEATNSTLKYENKNKRNRDNILRVSRIMCKETITRSENQEVLRHWRSWNKRHGRKLKSRKDSKSEKQVVRENAKTATAGNKMLDKKEMQTVLRLTKHATVKARKELLLEFWRMWNKKYRCRYEPSRTGHKSKTGRPAKNVTGYTSKNTIQDVKSTKLAIHSPQAQSNIGVVKRVSRIPVAKYSVNGKGQLIATKGLASWAVFQGGKEIRFEFWRNYNKILSYRSRIPLRKSGRDNVPHVSLASKRLIGWVIQQSMKESILEYWQKWNKGVEKENQRNSTSKVHKKSADDKGKSKIPVRRSYLNERTENKIKNIERTENKIKHIAKNSSSTLLIQMAKSLAKESVTNGQKSVARELLRYNYSKGKNKHEKHVHFNSLGQQVEFGMHIPDSSTEICIHFDENHEKIQRKKEKQNSSPHYDKTMYSKSGSRSRKDRNSYTVEKEKHVSSRTLGGRRNLRNRTKTTLETSTSNNGKQMKISDDGYDKARISVRENDSHRPKVSQENCQNAGNRYGYGLPSSGGRIPRRNQALIQKSKLEEKNIDKTMNNFVFLKDDEKVFDYKDQAVKCSLCKHTK